MDATLADLDVQLTRVRDARSRDYVLDAIRAYRAGALRPAVTAVWVAVAFDLISKYRELAGLGDAEARSYVDKWDRARDASSAEQLLKLERGLLEHASEKLQLLEPIGLRDLRRLVADRHLCAHPAFSTEAELFQPSAELVRLHIVNAIELVLSQRPVQGRTILSEFDRDVVSPGFPSDPIQIANYIEQRYLSRARNATISSFGSVLAKALLRDEPATWTPMKDKVEACLSCIQDRRPNEWAAVETDIVRLINELDPALRLNALSVLARFPPVMDRLEPATLTVIEQSIVNFDPTIWTDRSFFRAITLERFRPTIEEHLRELDLSEFISVLASTPIREFWPLALGHYAASGSFRGAESNFRLLIAPFQTVVENDDDLDALLKVIPENGQIYAAGGTSDLLFAFLKKVGPRAKPSFTARTEFHNALLARDEWVFNSHEELWEFFTEDRWERPPPLDG